MKVVEHKVGFINKYDTPIELYTEKPVTVYIDQFCFDPIPKGHLRIVMMEEPLRGELFDLVQKYTDRYDYVLTYEDEILQTNPKAVLFHATDTWVKGYVSPNKRFAVSTVVGGKNDLRMTGYALRHAVWNNQSAITIPTEFYLSGDYKWTHVDYEGQNTLGKSKTPLFDCMFHIAIENRPMKHYFSEKLLDCFHTRTVPIYSGCENIEDYFDIDGIIVVKTVEDIIEVCNNLTPEVYDSMKEAMDNNYDLAQPRSEYMPQLKDKLIEILNKIK